MKGFNIPFLEHVGVFLALFPHIRASLPNTKVAAEEAPGSWGLEGAKAALLLVRQGLVGGKGGHAPCPVLGAGSGPRYPCPLLGQGHRDGSMAWQGQGTGFHHEGKVEPLL